MFAVTGINKGFPIVHGSQGCSAFVRYGFARHFREPSEIAVTSLHEDAAVFGGRNNLVKGIENLAVRFKPELIGVITTCSSEIIGDDVYGFAETARENIKTKMGEDSDRIEVIPISTPSFVETHYKGYDNAIKAIVNHLARKNEPNQKVNIIPGILNPGDIRELKHLLMMMELEGIFLTDISDPFDAPLRPSTITRKPFYPKGGTSVNDIRDSANSLGTVSICKYAASGAISLEKEHNVPAVIDSPPIGLQNTDQFIRTIKKFTGNNISDALLDERGILADSMADNAARYLFGRKVAIYGDPDLTTGIARFVGELGMEPTMVCTGVKSPEFAQDMEVIAKETGSEIDVMVGQDLRAVEVYLKENPVDIMIGNSDGRLISLDLGIPLIRIGFPVYDRVGYQRQSIVGYRGGLYLMDLITNTILEKYYEPTHWKLQQ
jgi:nitrogenase molybdenum-iron protein beta chain